MPPPQINGQVSGIGIELIAWGRYFPLWWKCIFPWSIWSWPLSETGDRAGQVLAVMQDGSSSALLSNVSAEENLGEINRSLQEALSLQSRYLSFWWASRQHHCFTSLFLSHRIWCVSQTLQNSNSDCLERKIPRELRNFKGVWNRNAPGRGPAGQDDASSGAGRCSLCHSRPHVLRRC